MIFGRNKIQGQVSKKGSCFLLIFPGNWHDAPLPVFGNSISCYLSYPGRLKTGMKLVEKIEETRSNFDFNLWQSKLGKGILIFDAVD